MGRRDRWYNGLAAAAERPRRSMFLPAVEARRLREASAVQQHGATCARRCAIGFSDHVVGLALVVAAAVVVHVRDARTNAHATMLVCLSSKVFSDLAM